MTSEALRQSIRDYFSQPFEPRSSFIVLEDGELGTVARVPYDEFVNKFLLLVATSLPEKNEIPLTSDGEELLIGTGVIRGYNQAIDDFRKLLGGGDK